MEDRLGVIYPAHWRTRAGIWRAPVGFLTYTREGRMTVVIGDRKPLSGEDRLSTTAAERAETLSTFNAYAGRYTFDGTRVIHHVEVALFQNWVNTDQICFVALRGDRLTPRTSPRMLRREQRRARRNLGE